MRERLGKICGVVFSFTVVVTDTEHGMPQHGSFFFFVTSVVLFVTKYRKIHGIDSEV